MEIECPLCHERFKSEINITGKTVQCGSCQQTFLVDRQAITEAPALNKKSKDDFLNRLARTAPLDVSASPDVTTSYQQAMFEQQGIADVTDVMPLAPKNLIAIATGVFISLFGVSLFLIGGREFGMLQDVETSKRFVLAIFFAVIAALLIFLGHGLKKKRGAIVAVLTMLPLVAMPFLFKQTKPNASRSGPDFVLEDDEEPEEAQPLSPLELKKQFKDLISYEAVDKRVKALVLKGVPYDDAKENVYAVYLKLMSERNKYQVEEFIRECAGSQEQPFVFDRGEDNWLIVGTYPKVSLELMADKLGRIGLVQEVHEDLRVIEILVKNAKLSEVDEAILTDSKSNEFYHANLQELHSIDSSRVDKAIERLSISSPAMHRKQISKRMAELTNSASPERLEKLGKALKIWSVENDGLNRVVERHLAQKLKSETLLPTSIILFLAYRGNDEMIPILRDLWIEDPTDYEEIMKSLGANAETAVARALNSEVPAVQQSAVRILGAIGSEQSISRLEDLVSDANLEFQQLIRRSIESIREK